VNRRPATWPVAGSTRSSAPIAASPTRTSRSATRAGRVRRPDRTAGRCPPNGWGVPVRL